MRLLSLVALSVLLAPLTVLAQSSNRISADGGDIVITPIIHSSVQVEHAGSVIHVDPWSVGDLSVAKPADLILVTDDPGHHLDAAAIAELRKPGAPVVLTETAHARFADGSVLSNGESGLFADIRVEAVGAYDMTPGLPFHPRGEANGYVVTLGNKRLFFSGVGECVPEIQALENIDVAFMPMNLPVDRMRPIPLAECVKTFTPSVVYLNHYDQPYARWLTNPEGEPPADTQDTPGTIQAFEAAIAGTEIEFRDGNWYPGRSGQ
ncbi:MAG: MBL fold metallo-hydrolase [Acidobacteriota bacterium]|nr:MBL fold metallo-hydrolase [Acidobacteriota bacterium]